jgi:hypothetical protein
MAATVGQAFALVMVRGRIKALERLLHDSGQWSDERRAFFGRYTASIRRSLSFRDRHVVSGELEAEGWGLEMAVTD